MGDPICMVNMAEWWSSVPAAVQVVKPGGVCVCVCQLAHAEVDSTQVAFFFYSSIFHSFCSPDPSGLLDLKSNLTPKRSAPLEVDSSRISMKERPRNGDL